MTGRGRQTHKRGLSAIEALIAIAILGFAFSGLMSWRQAILRQHQRVDTMEQENRQRNNAMAVLADINPMAAPSGALEISPGETVSWRASPLSTRSRSTAYPSGDGDFIVALYRMDVHIDADGAPVSAFAFERLGWRALDESAGENDSQARSR